MWWQLICHHTRVLVQEPRAACPLTCPSSVTTMCLGTCSKSTLAHIKSWSEQEHNVLGTRPCCQCWSSPICINPYNIFTAADAKCHRNLICH